MPIQTPEMNFKAKPLNVFKKRASQSLVDVDPKKFLLEQTFLEGSCILEIHGKLAQALIFHADTPC